MRSLRRALYIKGCRSPQKAVAQVRVQVEGRRRGPRTERLHLRAFADPQHSQHNHDRSMSLSAHPIHRRLTDYVKATIEATSRRVGIRARDVRGIVQQKHLGTHYTRKDIYNARALLRREKLGGLGPTAALIRLFDERGVPYIVKWSTTEPGRLVGPGLDLPILSPNVETLSGNYDFRQHIQYKPFQTTAISRLRGKPA